MKQLPLPVRVAAGLAVAAVDRARQLPEKLAELPVTVVSQALQLSMRVQQQMTELAIKGDDALASFRPVEETPDWVRFDEDEAGPEDLRSAFDVVSADDSAATDEPEDLDVETEDLDVETAAVDARTAVDLEPDPWTAEQAALADEHVDGEFDSAAETGSDTNGVVTGSAPAAGLSVEDTAAAERTDGAGPAALPNYPELSVPQLRARLRRLSEQDLGALVDYERAHGDRPEYVGMLIRRIEMLRAQR